MGSPDTIYIDTPTAAAYRTVKKLTYAAIGMALAWHIGSAEAQNCIPAPIADMTLANEGAEVVATGQSYDGAQMRLYRKPDGQWLFINITPDGAGSCLIDRGNSLKIETPKPAGRQS